MKNIGNKILIFYTFQQDNQREYNMTALKSNQSSDIRIRDALASLPIDLSQGKYHFRFKTEFTQNNETIVGWIDISNLLAKVPMINSCIYIKILTLKEDKFNKLFNIQKLKKAQIFKEKENSAKIDKLKQSPQQKKPIQESKKQIQQPKSVKTIEPLNSTPKISKPPVSPSVSETSSQKQVQSSIIPQIIDFFPVNSTKEDIKPSTYTPQDSKAKLQRFQESFKAEQKAKEEQRIARDELQEQINKWGYTDGKKINNTPTLIATLHEIWPEWQPVSLSDLLTQEFVNVQFKKAVIKVHPDKNRSQPFRKKYLAKRVFELLNQSRKM